MYVNSPIAYRRLISKIVCMVSFQRRFTSDACVCLGVSIEGIHPFERHETVHVIKAYIQDMRNRRTYTTKHCLSSQRGGLSLLHHMPLPPSPTLHRSTQFTARVSYNPTLDSYHLTLGGKGLNFKNSNPPPPCNPPTPPPTRPILTGVRQNPPVTRPVTLVTRVLRLVTRLMHAVASAKTGNALFHLLHPPFSPPHFT